MDPHVRTKDAYRSLYFGLGLVLLDIEKPQYWFTSLACAIVGAASLLLIKLGFDSLSWLTITALFLACFTAGLNTLWIRLHLGDWVDEYNERIDRSLRESGD